MYLKTNFLTLTVLVPLPIISFSYHIYPTKKKSQKSHISYIDQTAFILQSYYSFKSHNPSSTLPLIVALYVQNFVCVLSLSSQLLLKNSPIFFDSSVSSFMCVSSLNSSISKAFHHILPYSAPLCKALHYSKTRVPWLMKSIFIIVLFFLNVPRNTLFCEGSRVFVKYILRLSSLQNVARWSKLCQAVSSKVGSKTGLGYY